MYNMLQSERACRLQALHETTRELMAADSHEAVADIAVCAASDILGFDASSVHLYDDEDGLVPVAATDTTRDLIETIPTFSDGDSIAWRVYQSGEPALFEDVRNEEEIYNPDTPIRSELHLPLGDYGILLAGSPIPSKFDEAELSLGKVVAANIEAALEQVEHKQELLQQNKQLEEFASVVSHDLRNPLTVAQGYLARVREAGKADQFDQLEQTLNRMERIIEDLLYLAREGEVIGTTEVVELGATIDAAWNVVDKDTTAELIITDDLGSVTADYDRLCQLLENLFRNTIDHGGADVTVRVEATETGFAITDNGPGIPAADREKVFERGYSTQETGTGFGLNIVANIVAAHGWDIRVTESEMGGARFEITGVR